jgi:hypothetical protein
MSIFCSCCLPVFDAIFFYKAGECQPGLCIQNKICIKQKSYVSFSHFLPVRDWLHIKIDGQFQAMGTRISIYLSLIDVLKNTELRAERQLGHY